MAKANYLRQHKRTLCTLILYMLIRHHDLVVLLDDAWWEDAGTTGFSPSAASYVATADPAGRRVCLIAIQDIAPYPRNPGVPIFNDSHFEGISAAERVGRLLQGFIVGDAIPPVELVRTASGPHPYKPVHGAHRIYCSLAAGFTHVPAVKGYDLAALDNPDESDNDQDLC